MQNAHGNPADEMQTTMDQHAGPRACPVQPGAPAKYERRRCRPPRPAAAADRLARPIYTCPMHPQIRQAGPGNCPICGMALEPVMPALDEDDESRARRFHPALLVDAAADASSSRCWRWSGTASAGLDLRARAGSSSCWRRRSCCGRAGRSSSAASQSIAQPQSEHVDADRHRRRAPPSATASSRRVAPASVPGAFREHGASACTSRPRR